VLIFRIFVLSFSFLGYLLRGTDVSICLKVLKRFSSLQLKLSALICLFDFVKF